MSIKKIPCGGFFYDDETIEFDGKVISAKGGGGGGDILVVTVSGGTLTEDETTTGKYIIEGATCDKTVAEMMSAKKVVVHCVAPLPYEGSTVPIYYMLPNVLMDRMEGQFVMLADSFMFYEGQGVIPLAHISMAAESEDSPLTIEGFVFVG